MLPLAAAALGVAYFLLSDRGPDYSVNTLRNERASLDKFDLKFASRGRDFACYDALLTNTAGDSISAQLRLPAADKRIRALVLLYESPEDLNVRSLLDGVPQSRFVATALLNVGKNFDRDASGRIKSSKKSLWKGLHRTKRELETMLQFLQKHQVVDSNQVYVAATEWAITPLLAGLAGLPNPVAGMALAEYHAGDRQWKESAPSEFVSAETWIRELATKKTAFVETSATPAGTNYPIPGDRIGVASKAEQTDAAKDREVVATILRWVAGEDTVVTPYSAIPDSIYRKSVRIKS
jgi:hypothetical protein